MWFCASAVGSSRIASAGLVIERSLAGEITAPAMGGASQEEAGYEDPEPVEEDRDEEQGGELDHSEDDPDPGVPAR
jgi:hypothetical protein